MKDVTVNELTWTDRLINRHMARILTELEQANCPVLYIEAVKSKLTWLRNDINEERERHENQNHQA